MCFWIRMLSQIHLTNLTIPIQNQKCPKNKKNACKDNHFPLAIWSAPKTLSSLHMHTPAALNKSVLAGTDIQAPQRNSRQQSPSFTLLLLPIYESETSRLVWGTVLVFDCDVSFIIPPYFQSPIKLFLGHFWFWMVYWVLLGWLDESGSPIHLTTRFGLKILIPKHTGESKIRHLEQILAQKR